MTELPECPFSNPSKTTWQNRMPWDELQFNTSAKAPQILLLVLQFFALAHSQSFLLAYLFLFFLLFSFSFSFLSSTLFSCPSILSPFISLSFPFTLLFTLCLPACTSLFSLFSFLICNKTKEHQNRHFSLLVYLSIH